MRVTHSILSLCTGVGALDIAVRRSLDTHGISTEFFAFAETDKSCAKVLDFHYPEVPNLGDITEIDWKDLMTGCIPDINVTMEMYDRYCQGASMEAVGHEFGVSRQTVFMRFKRAKLLTRPKKFLTHQEYNGVKFTLCNTGYLRRTDGDRELMHRFVWKSERGDIPPGHDIHHIDENKLNNDISNLEMMSLSDHAKFHYAERGGPRKLVGNIDIITAGFP